MKSNLPVTQREIDDPAAVCVSKTDPKASIADANDAFVQISGFSSRELIGSNPPIVRHPDMPEWASAGRDDYRLAHTHAHYTERWLPMPATRIVFPRLNARVRGPLFGSLLAIFCGALCAALPAFAQSKPPIKIGLTAEFGMPGSQAAQSIEKGLLLAINEINAAGGVLGRKHLWRISTATAT